MRENGTEPDSWGVFPTLGLDWEHCSHLVLVPEDLQVGKWMVLGL